LGRVAIHTIGVIEISTTLQADTHVVDGGILEYDALSGLDKAGGTCLDALVFR
jgi:hypothetical protein